MKIVALLPMKANSERVKGKNFKSFYGKPLFKWMLNKLLKIDQIDKVVINTDAREIINSHSVFDEGKIIIRDRPKHLCGDFVSMNKVIQNDIENIKADSYLMTHTTNPLVSVNSIIGIIDKYMTDINNGYDSTFSVNKIQTRFYDNKCKPINHNPNNLIRTQDLEVWYEENSNLYVFSKESFLKTYARIGANPSYFITNKIESTDIDSEADWEIAEALMSHIQKKSVK